MKKNMIIMVLSFSFFLSGCSSQRIVENEPFTCIDTPKRIGYEWLYEINNSEPLFEVKIPEVWTPQMDELLDTTIGIDEISIFGNEVWLNGRSVVYKYDILSQEVIVYPLLENNYIEYLLHTTQGELCGIVSGDKTTPIVCFDQATNQFVGEYFLSENGKNLDVSENYSGRADKIIEASPNTLWFLHQGKIYFLNLVEKTSKLVIDFDSQYTVYQIAKGPENSSLWVFVKDENNNIIIYLYENQNITAIESIQSSFFGFKPSLLPLEVETDDQNRVWISNRAWIEHITDRNALQLNSKPVILNKQLENNLFVGKTYNYSEGYYSPSYINILTDGSVWYSTLPGLIRMEPETGEYCMIASGVSSDVAEAPDGSIWFYYNGQLYKHEPVDH